MAKDQTNVRRLPGAGDGPLEPEDPNVVFARRVGAVIDAGYDQIVVLCGAGGIIRDIFGKNTEPFSIKGVLGDAPEAYYQMINAVIVVKQ